MAPPSQELEPPTNPGRFTYPDNDPDEVETRDHGRPVDRTAQLEAVRDNRAQETLKMITSLRMAAWVIAALLLIRLFV